MKSLAEISLRYLAAVHNAARVELEIQRRLVAQYKAEQMALYGLSSEDFDRLIELDRIHPHSGFYEAVTNEIAQQRIQAARDTLREFSQATNSES